MKPNTVYMIGAAIVTLMGFVAFVGIFVVGAAFGGIGGGGSNQSNEGGFISCSGDPFTKKNYKYGSYEDFVPLYQAAAAKYKLGPDGPAILASVHEHESAFGTNQGPSSAGAVGHMQFMPATWDAYGVDANKDGERDPADPEDAIFAAANYLKASGAPGDWRTAIFAYNHADWYVNMILEGAEKYKDKIEACE